MWCISWFHGFRAAPASQNMSGQAADPVNLRVNTLFNLQVNLTDLNFKKAFEVNQLA